MTATAIETFIQESDHSPTMREIGRAVGVSLSSVYAHILRLEKAGRVQRVEGRFVVKP